MLNAIQCHLSTRLNYPFTAECSRMNLLKNICDSELSHNKVHFCMYQLMFLYSFVFVINKFCLMRGCMDSYCK